MRSIGFAKGGVEWVELEVSAAEWNAMPGSGFDAIVAFGRTLGVDVKRFGSNVGSDGPDLWIQGTRL